MKLPLRMEDITSKARRMFTVIIMMVASVLCSEAQTLIDGLYYNLDYNTKTASVAKNKSASGDIVIPEKVTYDNVEYTVTSLEENSFRYSSISSIKLPSSVTILGNTCFANCNSLTSIDLPSSVMTLGNGCFSGCAIKSIKIPSSVTTLGNFCFSSCFSLTSVELPSSINTISLGCFQDCKSLAFISIPSSVSNLYLQCFWNCSSLKSIEIPSSVKSINHLCFAACTALEEIICHVSNPPTIVKKTFEDVNKSIPVYVPASSIDAYKNADYWSEFTNFQPIAEPAKTEWRISDRTDIDVDFHSINEAMDDERVQDGHTLYIERGSHLTDATITKKVTIVGPGYDLADDSRNAKVDLLIINAENAKVVGLQIQNALVCNNNVNIENCYIKSRVLGNETSYENDNCVIKSCFIDGRIEGRGDNGTFEWTLTNNIIKGGVCNFEEMTLNHNTIVSDYDVLVGVNFSTVTNNLLHQTKSESPIVDCSDNEYDKNVVSLASDTEGELLCETLEKSISCTGDANTEDYYTPIGVSLGYSTDDTDCGAFGGSNPYVKGGKSGLFVEREGEEEPEPVPEPTYPETPIAKGQLDQTATLDIENDVYNSLGAFLKALSIRNVVSGTEIAVADQQFDIALDEETYGYLQTAAVTLEMAKSYIYMKAEEQATFNIALSPTFAATHVTEVNQIAATIVTFANHIITTNITITINGQPYRYMGFQVEPNDLLDLKNLYQATDGANWTHRKWSFLSNGRQANDFPGVTFSEPDLLGYSRVVELDLVKNSMKGDVSNLTLYFPELTNLNLYSNQLSGDITQMVSQLSKLTTLDITYNMFTGLTSLPESVTTLNKGYQFRGDVLSEVVDKLNAVYVNISDKQSVGLPTIMSYDLKTNSNIAPQLYIAERSSVNAYYGLVSPIASDNDFIFKTEWVSDPYTYTYAQDHEIYLRTTDGTIYPAVLRYVNGDADMSGYTDLLDVQTTITEILNPTIISLFNKTAANTYEDELINVQDVVSTVNIVLNRLPINIGVDVTGTTEGESKAAMRRAAPVAGGSGNWLYTKDERLWLDNESEVAAVHVHLKGISADEVSLALNRKDFQLASRNMADGSHHIIYSLSGKTIPLGTTALLRLSHDEATVKAAQLSTVDAKELPVQISTVPTSIREQQIGEGTPSVRFDGQSVVITSPRAISQAEIQILSTSGVCLLSRQMSLAQGVTVIDTHLPAGIYIIGVSENGKRMANTKMMKK